MLRNFISILLFAISGIAFTQTKPNTLIKQYPQLKAVLVVGATRNNTSNAINKMEQVATVFQKYNIKVYRFYAEKAIWAEIKKCAEDANFFVYSGHGVINYGTGLVGGLIIATPVFSEDMISELKFKNKPVVILQSVCYAAGSSANDTVDIGIKLAKKRINEYSKVFLDMGASCYFASNYIGNCAYFISEFLSGKDLNSSFNSAYNDVYKGRNGKIKIEYDSSYIFNNKLNINICSALTDKRIKKYYIHKKDTIEVNIPRSYDLSYVGSPSFIINNLVVKK